MLYIRVGIVIGLEFGSYMEGFYIRVCMRLRDVYVYGLYV